MKTLVFYSSKPNYFIKNQFEIDDVLNLRIPIVEYRVLLKQMVANVCMYDSVEFITDLDITSDLSVWLNDYSKKVGGSLENQIVLFYDINNFPINTTILNEVLKKIKFANEVFKLICADEGNAEPVFSGIFGGPVLKILEILKIKNDRIVLAESEVELINIDGLTVRLDIPANIFKLFSSNFQLRHFNSIIDDGVYLVKKSSSKQKAENEFSFLNDLPSEVKPFFPQVGKSFSDETTFSYQVEKIFFFDSSKFLINGIFDKNRKALSLFIDKIGQYIRCLPHKEVGAQQYVSDFKSVVIEKNKDRLRQIQLLPNFEKMNYLFSQVCHIKIENIFEKMNCEIEKNIENKLGSKFYFSHGDLCLPNILFNSETGQIKLVDPRGGASTYLPIEYDLAKLSHSFVGLYDFIISDLFEISLDSKLNLELQIHVNSNTKHVLKVEFFKFLDTLKVDKKFVRLIEASLFLSMIPLHYEHEKRMLAQYLNGINILKELGVINAN